jgi:hypothetical protein
MAYYAKERVAFEAYGGSGVLIAQD